LSEPEGVGRKYSMRISELLDKGRPLLSFELFPPRTPEAARRLDRTLDGLRELNPDFVSVTYGAGGSTRSLTRDLVTRLAESDWNVVPHLTCLGQAEEALVEILEGYAALGVGNLLALRGDPPRDGEPARPGNLSFAADLVRLIRRFSAERGGRFNIGVAGFPEGHPGTPNRLLEMDHLKAKVDAGADYICTQLFFDNRDFLDFRDRCALAGIRVPILAGILPLTAGINLRRLVDLAGGARFPAPLLRHLAEAGGDGGEIDRVGMEYAAGQCSELLREGVDGIHIYTMNQSRAARELAGLVRKREEGFNREGPSGGGLSD